MEHTHPNASATTHAFQISITSHLFEVKAVFLWLKMDTKKPSGLIRETARMLNSCTATIIAVPSAVSSCG